MTDARVEAVERFYDFHPINARQILDAVAARGIAPDAITEAVLQQHDQDHYGGTAATDRLIAEAGVRADDTVLDVCSGMGGPARYLAWKTGCDVTGLDLTASRVEGATELTRVAGLSRRVRFVHGDALAMPFPDASFTLAIAQESFAHIPDKPRLLGECARVLRPAGRLVFSDILHRGDLTAADARRLFDGMAFFRDRDGRRLRGAAARRRDGGRPARRPDGRMDAHPGRAARDVPLARAADRGPARSRALRALRPRVRPLRRAVPARCARRGADPRGQGRVSVATVLDRELKRRVTVDGVEYTVAVDPEGLRLIGKGKRRPEVELRWRDLLSGDAAMAAALNASLSTPAPARPAGGRAPAPDGPGRRAPKGRAR